MKRIGILGGTFDPPHLGHLIIADIVKDTLKLDEVWFIPNDIPPHKVETKTSNDDRINMVNEAIKDNDSFTMNTIEIERKGTSYTIDTVKTLKERYPHKLFYFIIGADMVEYLPHWYEIDELMQLITFVGVKRRGYQLQTKYPIKTVDMPTIEISSSDIRERIKQGKTVKYFLPKNVLSYIRERSLYED